MSKLSHKEKTKMAKRLQTRVELLARRPLFDTVGWNKRKEAIAKRVAKIEATRKFHTNRRKLELGKAQ